MSNSKLNLEVLRSIVRIIAGRRHHQGHAVLDFDNLVCEGNLLIAEMIRDGAESWGQGPTEALLRKSFENRITDLRRAQCLTKSRGARTTPLSQMVNDFGQQWEPGEDDNPLDGTFHFSKNPEAAFDFKKQVERIWAQLDGDCRAIFVTLLDSQSRTGGPSEVDIQRELGMSRPKFRKCLGRIRDVTGSVLYEAFERTPWDKNPESELGDH